MQSRAFIRSPQVCRIIKAAPAANRTMSLFSAPGLVSRPFPINAFGSLDREIAPFFRMVDDFSRAFDHILPAAANSQRAAPFQPRFDVREIDGAYELRGELPGVESSNIEVEFTDPQTLVIRGRTESETSSGTPAAETQTNTAAVEASPESAATTNAVADDAASTHSTSSYQKATVEDEAGTSTAAADTTATSTPGQATPAESTVAETQPAQQQPTTNTTAANTSRYWVSERRTGSFQRVFSFPGKVDQQAVTASLKNGILNVVVPKAVAPAPRRITVE